MSLKTPKFWYAPPEEPQPFTAKALLPLSGVYRILYTLHQHTQTPYHAEIPVLCIGNLVAGGTGKTPTVLALLKIIKDSGLAKNPYFLIRGYGGAEIGPLQVDLNKHSAWDVGDEALLLSKHAPTIVAADRANGARLAQNQDADLIIMDDGLQNLGIHKDIKLVVINGEMGFGNQHLLPSGPLRQPLDEGLKNADGFILIGDDLRHVAGALPAGKPLINANLHAITEALPPKNKHYLAFAGLGYPEKFFNFLKKQSGLFIADCIRFADHYPYTRKDVMQLDEKARSLSATLLTTEKDKMRLPDVEGVDIHVLPVEMVIENPDDLIGLIKPALKNRL